MTGAGRQAFSSLQLLRTLVAAGAPLNRAGPPRAARTGGLLKGGHIRGAHAHAGRRELVAQLLRRHAVRRLVGRVEARLGGRRAVEAATVDHARGATCARARLTLAAALRRLRRHRAWGWSAASSCGRLERLLRYRAVLLVQLGLPYHGLPRRIPRGLGGRRTLDEGDPIGHGPLAELVSKRHALLPQPAGDPLARALRVLVLDETRAVLLGDVAAVARPRAVEGRAVGAQCALEGRHLGVLDGRVVAAALVRLVRVLHLELEAAARAGALGGAAEAIGGIVVLEPV
eukprot:scaffold30743_cov60-Phaeocystis_antarctica.AAC.1